MATSEPRPILVAVGPDDSEAALQFAAADALRAGCGLHLVHVVRVGPTGPATGLLDVERAHRLGAGILAGARERAEDLVHGLVPLTSELVLSEPVVRAIVDRSEGARRVVLQRRQLSALGRLTTSSKSGGVAARAHIPVVAVPANWTVPVTAHGLVTVGVHDEPDVHVVSCAFEAAQERGAALRVLHAWWLSTSFDDAVIERATGDEWYDRAPERITKGLSELSADFPDVPVEVDVVHQRPTEALVEAAAHSDLVVVGRRDPLLPFGSHLGPVARTVLREAEAPVLVVEPHALPQHRRGSPSG